jgi:hypothetical protein
MEICSAGEFVDTKQFNLTDGLNVRKHFVRYRTWIRTAEEIMSGLLIDDSGIVWPAEPAIISRRFGLRQQRDFVGRAIDFGFVFITIDACGVRIVLRPQFVSRPAVSRLFGIIGRRNSARLALARDAHLSSWELIVGAERAIARIEGLIAEARSPSPRPLLTARRLPLERSLDIAGGQLFPILEAWGQRQGRWEPELHERLLEWQLLPITVISEQQPDSERLLIRHWGANLTMFGKAWTRAARGREYEDQPNGEMGRWRAGLLRQMAADGVPRYTKSDLVLNRVDWGLTRLTFFRLALPWRTPDGAVVVTATNAARRRVLLEQPNRVN